MQYPIEYLNDILVRMAHHSSAIEGNTISLPETVSIILENTLPASGKSIREFYEVSNHKEAFNYIIGALDDNAGLSISLIKDIHALLTDRLQHDRGQFKTSQNAIVGAEFKTASPAETPFLIKQWADNTAFRLQHAESGPATFEVLADTHIQFERIHPFSDGNGRTGRLILMYLSMKYLCIPVIINKEYRAKYLELLAEQDTKGLAELLSLSADYEAERLKQFSNTNTLI